MAIWLVTGRKRIGKTTACLAAARLAKAQGIHVGGALALPRYHRGRKAGIDALDLATDETRPLAEIVRDQSRATVGEYSFDDQTTAWMLDVILDALKSESDMVFVDEIGRLELGSHQGLYPAIAAGQQSDCPAIMIVTRDNQVTALARELEPAKVAVLTVTETNRACLPQQIVLLAQQERSGH